MLCRLHEYGLTSSTYEKIRCDIRESPHFRFNWFLRSRTTLELKRRCQNLLSQLSNKETQDKKPKIEKPKAAKGDVSKTDATKGETTTKKGQKRKADKIAGADEIED